MTSASSLCNRHPHEAEQIIVPDRLQLCSFVATLSLAREFRRCAGTRGLAAWHD